MDGMGWDGMDGWLSLYDGLLRAPTVLINVQICFWSPSYKNLFLSVRTTVLKHQRTNIILLSCFFLCLSYFFCLLFIIFPFVYFVHFVPFCSFSVFNLWLIVFSVVWITFMACLKGFFYWPKKEKKKKVTSCSLFDSGIQSLSPLRHAMKVIQQDSFKNVPFLQECI